MRLNPRHCGESLSRSALKQEMRCQLAELRALQRIMDAISSPTINGTAATEYKLILLDPFAPRSSKDAAGNSAYEVVPDGTGLDIHMSSDRRTTYGYTLRLAALAPYDAEPRKRVEPDVDGEAEELVVH